MVSFACNSNFELIEGDLLFQDLDSSPICDAIELVTPGYQDANLSHIGVVVYNNGQLKVLEAIPPAVILTDINSFLNRSFDKYGKQKVMVGRLKKEYKEAIPDAINFMKNKIGIKYDDEFLLNNNSYYCSELIYEAFIKDSIFKLEPMNFLHPITKDTLLAWKQYYSNLKREIPQEKLGINPGTMSLSKKIDIVHFYGMPNGIKRQL